MILGDLLWGAPDWKFPAAVTVLVAVLVVAWSYLRADSPGWVRISAAALKIAGIVALGICLVEPLFSGTRPRPQANLFLLLADNSASLQIRDRDSSRTRADQLKDSLRSSADWQTRLNQDFDVRRYQFDSRLRPLQDFDQLSIDGHSSSLATSLHGLAERFQGRPIAGLLVLTDGNATDLSDADADWSRLPPVFPVVMGQDRPAADIGVSRVSVSQTNFEAAPVTILAEVTSHHLSGQRVVLQLLDEAGKEAGRHTAPLADDGKPLIHRFQIRPETSGVSFYRVRAFAESEAQRWQQPSPPERTVEATTSNNTRQVAVDRGGGPYRVLYVSGRANWEFKFLRRALQEDDEVNLVGLVRMAKREAKFTFRGRPGENTNPFYRGFGNPGDEQAEQYDEPVLLRLGTEDKDELRDGFPKAADQLYRYHAVILDDVESAFFTQDQMSLLQQFVSQRGGGLLMLGGQESLDGGEYDRTPVEELLPVYLDRFDAPPVERGYRLQLTREGWLQPWMRLRSTEQDEQVRLRGMPHFKTVNRLRSIKPGATVLAHVQSPNGTIHPALVAQNFGQGRSASLLIGDLWRWQLRRDKATDDDLGQAWRQMVRWLVADVPQPVRVRATHARGETGPVRLEIELRDKQYQPLDNATVSAQVATPDGRQLKLTAEPDDRRAGAYVVTFLPPVSGAYRATVVATAADGSTVGEREIGWVAEPDAEEFRVLTPNLALLQRIAQETGGELLRAEDLDAFVDSLSRRKVPVVEPWVYPLWHQWSVFLFAVACLVGEWGLRRWRGLP